jgi:hypothetical protein
MNFRFVFVVVLFDSSYAGFCVVGSFETYGVKTKIQLFVPRPIRCRNKANQNMTNTILHCSSPLYLVMKSVIIWNLQVYELPY